MIRLQRTGRKNDPHFRLVLTEKTTSPRGKHIELLGFINPKSKARSLEKERISHWLSKGAQMTPRVNNILISSGFIKGEKIAVHKYVKKAAEPAKAAEVSAAPAEAK